MIESLRSFAMLVTVLDEGSFQAAAAKINVSPTVISQNIKALEERFNCVLLDRSCRVLRPTPQGQKLIGPVRAMMNAAQRGLEALQSDTSEVSGKIVVSVPKSLSGGVLASIAEEFLLANPRVQMELRFQNKQAHPIYDDSDLTIGFQSLLHERLAHREIRGGGAGFYAAPDLAERIERTDLQKIPLRIPLLMSYGLPTSEWIRLFGLETHGHEDAIPFRLRCDDVSIVHRMCLSGAGLAILPHTNVQDDIKSGRLVRVLRQLPLELSDFVASWQIGSPAAPIVERFLDHILQSLDQRLGR